MASQRGWVLSGKEVPIGGGPQAGTRKQESASGASRGLAMVRQKRRAPIDGGRPSRILPCSCAYFLLSGCLWRFAKDVSFAAPPLVAAPPVEADPAPVASLALAAPFAPVVAPVAFTMLAALAALVAPVEPAVPPAEPLAPAARRAFSWSCCCCLTMR